MKIIAASVVLLAATASAGESSLRLGRRGLKPGGNGNGRGKAKGIGYYCCRAGNGEPGDEDAAKACAAIDPDWEAEGAADDECTGNVAKEDFNVCEYTEDGDCDHVDISSDSEESPDE
jgi:hypothetical protein